MKFKIFSSDLQWKAEAVVNDWLAQQTLPLTVHLSETRMEIATSLSGTRTPMVTVSLWYSESETPATSAS